MSVTAGVSDAALATRAKLRGGIAQTKVTRYWPGQAPKWADKAEQDHDDDVRMHIKDDDDLMVARFDKDDPRLRRLAQTRADNREQVRADHQRVRQAAEVISTQEDDEDLRNQESSDEEEDEDAMEERRRRIRERNLKRAQEEASLLPLEEEEEVQDDEEESEFETDSEDEMIGITMIKPFFVPKGERDTVAERDLLEAKEEALEELAKKKLEMRITETKQIVVEEVRKDEEIQKHVLVEEDVETDDEINEAEEYEIWKTRETDRIKRERDAEEATLREKEEIDKNLMTEEESKNQKPKRKWKFMQRYYHKGAFFQEEGSVILQRDFSAPTGEDKLNKLKVREVMQVKNFGRSGRSKWTHLVKEDTTYGDKKTKTEGTITTDWSNLWTFKDLLGDKYKRKIQDF
ncbi:unnamed protein product [Microthlaspi erraticum]|uniref:Micro-fibrillar-associated protein 1 C-terminal domain-containing protein n=1 Tax=Microthlaspi erraticum TaxID=1685480 RepID=A0A6D2I7Y1_9BRAS|nr:unnamed protein product [Microthlaspi erraticum]